MPKKKKQVKNGFYWYMQDLIPELRREGHHINGIATVVPLAHPRWKNLSPQDKEIYDEKAKVEKRKESAQTAVVTGQKFRDTRLDNVGQLIASRVSPEEAALKRRAKESRITKSRWPNGDNASEEMLDYQFYFIAFEYLCEMEENDVKSYLPIEVGAIEYTMRSGITRRFHRHIKPAPIPLGYRYGCMHHSDETHQIPVEGHDDADNNYLGIYIQLENFINPSGTKKEYPAMHTLGTHLECAESCLQWIHLMARNAGLGHPSRLQKVYEVENMVVDLLQLAGEPAISRAPILDVLSSSSWDYEANTRCAFHEEMGNKHCALYSVQNWAYLLSDFLADIYKFDLIPGKHQPEPSEYEFIAIPPMPMIERRQQPAPRSSSYSSLVQDGGHSFGGRDVRHDQKKFVINTGPGSDDDDSGSDTDFDSVLEMELSRSSQKAKGDSNHVGGLGRGMVLPSGAGDPPWVIRGTPAPSLMDDDDFPALGAPGPAKPRQRQPAPAQRFPGPPPSVASSFSSVPPPSSMSSAASVISSQYDSDEEDVLARPSMRIKTLSESVKEKELAEKTRKFKPVSVSTVIDPKPPNVNFNPASAGRGTGPRAMNAANAVNTGFKPSLGSVSYTANAGQGRGAMFQSGGSSSMLPGGRGRGRGGPSAPSVASFASSQDSSRTNRAAPRVVNSNPAWAGIGRGIGKTPAPSETSSVLSGFTNQASSVLADDNESLASSTATFSSMSCAGRGRGMWTAKKKPVLPPPGFGLGNTLADRMRNNLSLNDDQFQDAQGS